MLFFLLFRWNWYRWVRPLTCYSYLTLPPLSVHLIYTLLIYCDNYDYIKWKYRTWTHYTFCRLVFSSIQEQCEWFYVVLHLVETRKETQNNTQAIETFAVLSIWMLGQAQCYCETTLMPCLIFKFHIPASSCAVALHRIKCNLRTAAPRH